MKICEYCGKNHEGSFGSGRFCSRSCSCGFSTKVKRKEINKKISKALKNKNTKSDVKLICEYCKNTFNIRWSKRHQRFCSRSCATKFKVNDPKWKRKISESMKGVNIGKKNGMYGKTPTNTRRIKVFSNKEPRKTFYVKSSYEAKYIDILNEDTNVTYFQYEPKQFRVSYKDKKGNDKTYQPDFYVNNKIIEIKNLWSSSLYDTKIKERAFRSQFPDMVYEIVIPI